MYSLTKDYKIDYKDKSLLLLSTVVVCLVFYTSMQNSKHITISPKTSRVVSENIISLVITPAPVIKKKSRAKVKKVIKEKVIKKILKTKTIERVIEKTETLEVAKTPEVYETLNKKITAPVFDANMKALFISGLYDMLNERKNYPKMAKRRKLEGISQVSFTLNKDGSIKKIFLQESCGHKILDKAALKVVQSIKFYKPIPDAVSMASLHLNIPIKYSRN